jgi:hypothetical protein
VHVHRLCAHFRTQLDYASFRAAVKKNEATIERVLHGVLSEFCPAIVAAIGGGNASAAAASS